LIGAAVANKALPMTGIAIFGAAFGALAAIDTSLRAFDIFGEAPRVPQLRTPISSGRSTTDDPGFSPR